MKRRAFKIIGILLASAIGLYCVELAVPKRDYFVERVGSPGILGHSVTVTDAAVSESVTLESSTGLRVELRVLRPAGMDGARVPLVLLLGGHETGKDAVDLVGAPGGIAFAAIDYPYTGSRDIDSAWQSIAAVPHIQRAFLDAPPALSLALGWALEQPWVDPLRVELAGVSLGVPFAAVAGATDPRFSRVWLLHGGADNASWVAHAGRKRIGNHLLRKLIARVALFLVYGNSFDTEYWMREIAPRPLVLVAACDDDYVPPEAQAPLVDVAAGESVELIWTDGMHIGPGRRDELDQLLAIVTGRILGEPPPPAARCAPGR